ncbi:MAG TPA: hypothetical protein VLJ16_11400 [Acidobacteriota bacterium]|nr:hypothetical protein [Acidobacteriota bacterium]
MRLWAPLAAAVILAAGLTFAGPRPDGARGSEKACRECHEQVALGESVHKGLACTDCHAGVASRPGTPPHQPKKDMPPPSCASGSCHQEAPDARPGGTPAAYPDSVHGRANLERHEPEVARCWDCHGRHNIRPLDDPQSTVNRRNIPLTCSRCHEDMQVVVKYNIHAESPYQEYRKSAHGRGLYDKGLLEFAAVCTDCHGVHNIQGVGSARIPAKDPATCGKCHRLVLEEYADSIHGRDALKGNVDVPLCVDCHGEHTVAAAASPQAPTSKTHVADTCSVCHARPEIMRKYGVSEDRIRTFIESFHGIAIGLGGKAEADCVDCHGVHDIRPASDPRSKVNPANMAKTCGQPSCHPAMTEKIAGTKIHRDYNRAKSGAPFYFKKILVWSVFLITALTLIFFIPILIRRRGGPAAR